MANQRVVLSGVDKTDGTQADVFVEDNAFLSTLATTLAGEDAANDQLHVALSGPTRRLIYTPDVTGVSNTALGSAKSTSWLDVAGWRKITVWVRIAGSYGGSSFGIDVQGTPVQEDVSFGSTSDWATKIATKQNITAVGKYVLTNLDGSAVGGTCSQIRVDIGAAGGSANGWVWVLCEA